VISRVHSKFPLQRGSQQPRSSIKPIVVGNIYVKRQGHREFQFSSGLAAICRGPIFPPVVVERIIKPARPLDGVSLPNHVQQGGQNTRKCQHSGHSVSAGDNFLLWDALECIGPLEWPRVHRSGQQTSPRFPDVAGSRRLDGHQHTRMAAFAMSRYVHISVCTCTKSQRSVWASRGPTDI